MRTILHVDGDAFFASCEIAQNPLLKGKPVVVGEEKGIATAFSYEAKALGIRRGMRIWEIKKQFPQVIIVPSHFDLYKICSNRMMHIVQRYSDTVQEYSVDECFADISDLALKIGALAAAKQIKTELEESLGMTFSIGVAPTKVLAKVASKWVKPSGLTIITPETINQFLQSVPIEKVWGIGPSTSIKLKKKGIATPLQLIQKNEAWAIENLAKPHQEIWHELRGTQIFSIKDGSIHDDPTNYKSLMKSRTFKPPSADPDRILSELSYNVERLCNKLRRNGLYAQIVHAYVKTQEFNYRSIDIKLPHASRSPQVIVSIISERLGELIGHLKGSKFRATGVTAWNLSTESSFQADLFGNALVNNISGEVLLNKKVRDKVFLASSLRARKENPMWRGRERFNIPYMGEAR